MVVTPRIATAMATAVTRANDQAAEPNRLFDQAIEQFEMTAQWPGGHTIVLLSGWLRRKRSVVSLGNDAGWIKLTITVNGLTQFERSFVVGYYDLKERRWTQARSCTLAAFNRWQQKCTAEINRLEDKNRI